MGARIPAEDLTEAEQKLLTAADGTLADLRARKRGMDNPARGAGWDLSRQIRASVLAGLLTGTQCPGGKVPRIVKVRGARITGTLDLEAATLVCPLLLHGCYFDKPVNLSEVTAPAIKMPGCHLPGLTAVQLRTARDLGLDRTRFTAGTEVSLVGARIGGTLDISGAHLANSNGPALNADGITIEEDMACSACFVADGGIRLVGAHIRGELQLGGARLASKDGPALQTANLTVDQDMLCNENFRARGEVNLIGARIRGILDMSGAQLICKAGFALNADRLEVGQDVFCRDGFEAQGQVDVPGARIGGEIDLRGAKLTNPGGLALNADGLEVGQNVDCREIHKADGTVRRFTATGGMWLPGAHISGTLNMRNAKLTNPGGDRALAARGLILGEDMLCDKLEADGEVSLTGARISGRLDLRGAKLANPGRLALNARGLEVGQDMCCWDGFEADGQVDLSDARIGGQLDLCGARITSSRSPAFNGDGLTVRRDMTCQEEPRTGGTVRPFTADGGMSLIGAHLSGRLQLGGAHLVSESGPALAASHLTVDQDMSCDQNFRADGEMSLIAARISGQLDLSGSTLGRDGGRALDLKTAEVSILHLLPAQCPVGVVDLSYAKVGTLGDEPASWPAKLDLKEFTYDSLANRKVSTRQRLEWLTRNRDGYIPQVYDQLAAAYRRAGDEPAARKVAVAKQWRRRRWFNPLNWLWYATVGYGYRTWLTGIWLVALVGLGTWVFSGAYPAHMTAISTNPPPFHAPVYALDILLPVIGLGQKTAWQPKGSAYLYWSWALTVTGWVLATAVAAGLTGILKRD